MTEHDWLTSTDPAEMIGFVTGHIDVADAPRSLQMPSNRQLRLFACAACRQVWDKLTDDAPCERCEGSGVIHPRLYCPDCNDNGLGQTPGRVNRSRRAVLVAERFADGLATDEECRLAIDAAFGVVRSDYSLSAASLAHDCLAMRPHTSRHLQTVPASTQANLLREIIGNPFQASRDFRFFQPDWLTPTVYTLAQLAYEERADDGSLDPLNLAVLADALEEAGCVGEDCPECAGSGGPWEEADTEEPLGWMHRCHRCNGARRVPHPILAHLRSPGSHVRGCWAVDLLLGKS